MSKIPEGAVKLHHNPVTKQGHQCERDGDVDHFGRVVCVDENGQWWAWYTAPNEPFFVTTDKATGEVTISVELMRVGVPTANGTVYNITKEELTEQLKRRIGKPIGEIGGVALNYALASRGDLTPLFGPKDWESRYETIDYSKQAGVLSGFQFEALTDEAYRVLGDVTLSKQLQELNDATPSFGIRAFVKGRYPDPTAVDIDRIISFDYLPPHQRIPSKR